MTAIDMINFIVAVVLPLLPFAVIAFFWGCIFVVDVVSTALDYRLLSAERHFISNA